MQSEFFFSFCWKYQTYETISSEKRYIPLRITPIGEWKAGREETRQGYQLSESRIYADHTDCADFKRFLVVFCIIGF